MTRRVIPLLVMAGAGSGVLSSCGGTCQSIPSCIPQPAIRVTVTTAVPSGAVAGVVVEVSPSFPGSTTCTVDASVTVCTVLGGLGQYTLRVGAPGYQTVQTDVTVGGTTRACDCSIVSRRDVVVVLQRAS